MPFLNEFHSGIHGSLKNVTEKEIFHNMVSTYFPACTRNPWEILASRQCETETNERTVLSWQQVLNFRSFWYFRFEWNVGRSDAKAKGYSNISIKLSLRDMNNFTEEDIIESIFRIPISVRTEESLNKIHRRKNIFCKIKWKISI